MPEQEDPKEETAENPFPAVAEDQKEEAPPPEPAPPPPEPAIAESPRVNRVLSVLAVLSPGLFFFALPPLSKSGLWDPYELNVADLARRVAVNLFGASQLALAGADNSLPHLNDLARPELPFTSIALGFKLFGLHEWSGRLPLALWGLAGVLATYAFIARLFDRRAGLYAAIALTTMPLYFVQARSMLGEITTMSALAMSFGGLAVAVFDRDEKGATSFVARVPWILMAAVGLVGGYYSRGGFLGVAVPALGIGVAWALSWASGGRKKDPAGDLVGLVSLLLGAWLLARGVMVFASDPAPKDLSMAVGAMLRTQAKYPTFDFYIAAIGHAAAPWSAFFPFAIGRLFTSPVGRTGELHTRESTARMAILVGSAMVLFAHGFLAARTDLVAFTGPALMAAACGVAIRDFERGAHASIAVGVGTAVLLGVFHHDFHELPDKAYQAYAVVNAAFPESFKKTSLALWWAVLGGFAAIAFLTWVERDAKRTPFDPKNYLKVIRSLREVWDGLLSLVFFASVAGTSLAGLVVWVGLRTQAKWLPMMSVNFRDMVMNAWWIVALVPLGAILGIFFACDVWLWAFERSRPFSKASLTRGFEPFEETFARVKSTTDRGERAMAVVLMAMMTLIVPVAVLGGLVLGAGIRPLSAAALAVPSGVLVFLVLGALGDLLRHRAAGMAAGGAVIGFLLCFFYYPALANQLSPKEVFESYQRTHKPGEPLALLGVGGRTSAYYAGGQPVTFTDPMAAHDWLTSGGQARRYLALRAEDLPRLNMIYRERSTPRQNLPILDGRSSQIMLAASSLVGNEKNENPLGKIVLSAPPKPHRKLDVNMDDKLQVLGIDLNDLSGRAIESVAPGKKYKMRIYYRVLAPVGSEWEAFIHIDGYRRRHNGDHKPMAGKYPMTLWLKDDLLVDEYEFALEPNFTPGNYNIYFGLFVGDTRFKIKSGPSDGDNRINGGALRVQ